MPPRVPAGAAWLAGNGSVGAVHVAPSVPDPVPESEPAADATGHNDQPVTMSERGSFSSDWKNISRLGNVPATPSATGNSVMPAVAAASVGAVSVVPPVLVLGVSGVAVPGVIDTRSTPDPLAAAES